MIRVKPLAARRVSKLSRSPFLSNWAEVLFFPTVLRFQVVQGEGGKRNVLASAAISVKDLYEVGIPRRF